VKQAFKGLAVKSWCICGDKIFVLYSVSLYDSPPFSVDQNF